MAAEATRMAVEAEEHRRFVQEAEKKALGEMEAHHQANLEQARQWANATTSKVAAEAQVCVCVGVRVCVHG